MYLRDIVPWEIYEEQLRAENYRQMKERKAQKENLRKQRKKEEEEAARMKRQAEEREKAEAEEAARIKRETEEQKKAEEDKAVEEASRIKREAEKQREEEECKEASQAEWLRNNRVQLKELLRRDEAVKAQKNSIILEQNRHDYLTEQYDPTRNSRGTCVCLGCKARFNRLLEEKVHEIMLIDVVGMGQLTWCRRPHHQMSSGRTRKASFTTTNYSRRSNESVRLLSAGNKRQRDKPRHDFESRRKRSRKY